MGSRLQVDSLPAQTEYLRGRELSTCLVRNYKVIPAGASILASAIQYFLVLLVLTDVGTILGTVTAIPSR